jgi:hypothetical protein
LTQNETPEQRQPDASPSVPLNGEIVGMESGRIRVRLETGVVGFLVVSTEGEESLELGQQGTFRVRSCNENAEPLLDLAEIENEEPPRSFDHDVSRLQDALNYHHVPPVAREETASTMDEQRIQDWLTRVEQNLKKLRRNRSSRLNEELYTGS